MPTVAEYFAGIGLVRLGLEQAGWETIFANDWSEEKREMYEDFFGDADDYVREDIFKLDTGIVPQTDLATCSFPCIDLSLAGNRDGIHGEHSSAFWGVIRVLRDQGDAAPPHILVENVPGWLSSNKGADFRLTIQSLNELGYAVDVVLLDALRFTPQSRERVFVVGSRSWRVHTGCDGILNRPESLCPERLVRALNANMDLNWISLPVPEPPPLLGAGLTSTIIQRFPAHSKRWWSRVEVHRHLAMMNKKHRAKVEALVDGQSYSYRTFYRRRRNMKQRAEVRDDDIAGCLRTACGGSSRQFVVMAGRGQIKMRSMTPREYARLQGVPDELPILVDDNQAVTGLGDAVCVPAVAWVGHNMLNRLL